MMEASAASSRQQNPGEIYSQFVYRTAYWEAAARPRPQINIPSSSGGYHPLRPGGAASNQARPVATAGLCEVQLSMSRKAVAFSATAQPPRTDRQISWMGNRPIQREEELGRHDQG